MRDINYNFDLNGGRYTKHIYAGTQRIASKLGDIDAFGADPRRVATAGHDVDNAEPIDFGTKYKNQNDAFKARFDSLGSKFNGKTLDDYINGKSFCCGDNSLDEIEQNNTQSAESAKLEDNLYFYHPDHLGSTSMVTNYDGEVTQNVAYIPYGEVFVEERNGSWTTPFLFNAKELDEETGLYYYGARYLDPVDARWLAVDPMFEKYAGMSPYNHCAGNPVKLVDPDGRVIKVGDIIYVPGKTKNSMGKTDFERNTIMALNYLYNGKSDKVKGVIEKLSNTQRYNITIQKSNDSRVTRAYSEKEQLLEWDDYGAMETDNGAKLSPANGLFHELGHLDLHLDIALAEDANDSEAFDKAISREFPDDDPTFIGPCYEYYPVREYETEAAISNGEFVPSETKKYTRKNYHEVRTVKVESPISNDFE